MSCAVIFKCFQELKDMFLEQEAPRGSSAKNEKGPLARLTRWCLKALLSKGKASETQERKSGHTSSAAKDPESLFFSRAGSPSDGSESRPRHPCCAPRIRASGVDPERRPSNWGESPRQSGTRGVSETAPRRPGPAGGSAEKDVSATASWG